jgi:alginate O-acetyltransferase complex protein AlgI
VVVADGLLAPRRTTVFGPPPACRRSTRGSASSPSRGRSSATSRLHHHAIGASLALGFSLVDNFRYPYAAIGFSDFWRRWHISLSTWLRDYLYVPLGGNRRGPGRTYVNLMLTMLIGGLWHGAAWTFVVWGGLHGLFLCAERLLRGRVGGWRSGGRFRRSSGSRCSRTRSST